MNQLTLVVAVGLWAVVALRVRTVTAGGAQRYLWLALVALAAAVTLDGSSVAAAT